MTAPNTPVQASAPDPLDELEKFMAGQIATVERDQATYLRHAARCGQVAAGLRASLEALRAKRAQGQG